jgi:hypothetical protein
MKMKYEDLARLKIDVQTNNDRNFLELAILFDKPEFLEYLPKIRKKYKIDPLIKIEEYDQLMDKYFKSEESKFDFSTYENAKELINYANKNVVWYEEIEDADMTKYQKLDTDAAILCYLFHRPPYFAYPIKQAILCGAVNGDLFATTSNTIVEQDTLYSTTGQFQLPQVAVLISLTSTDIEIKEQIRRARDLFKTDPKLSYYIPRIDQVNQIRLYREWYWKTLADIKNTKILAEWVKNPNRDPNSDMDESRISKGISHYRTLLSI